MESDLPAPHPDCREGQISQSHLPPSFLHQSSSFAGAGWEKTDGLVGWRWEVGRNQGVGGVGETGGVSVSGLAAVALRRGWKEILASSLVESRSSVAEQ